MLSVKKKIEVARSVTAFAVALVSPFAGWALGQTTLRGAFVLSGIAGVVALHQWLTTSPLVTDLAAADKLPPQDCGPGSSSTQTRVIVTETAPIGTPNLTQ